MRLIFSYYRLRREHQLRTEGRIWQTTINKEDQNPVKLSPPPSVSSPQLYYPISSVFLPSLLSASLPMLRLSFPGFMSTAKAFTDAGGGRHLCGCYLSLAAGEGRRIGSDRRPCTTRNPMPTDDAIQGQPALPPSLPYSLSPSLFLKTNELVV